MSYELFLSATAKQHIREQRLWYHDNLEDGLALANRWTRELEAALHGLCRNPERHGLAAAGDQIEPGLPLRRMLFRPWTNGRGWKVIFCIDEETQIVTVLHIRHESRPPLADDKA